MDMDREVLLMLNGAAASSDGVAIAVAFLASYLPYLIVVAFALVLWRSASLTTQEKLVRFGVALTAGFFARVCVTSLIRVIAPRARPFSDPEVHKLIDLFNNAAPSFPSGHASFLFAFVTVAMIYDRRFGYPALIAAALVSLGRVAAGVHYPSDVLVGMAIGVACGALLARPISALETRALAFVTDTRQKKTPRRMSRPGV